MPLTAHRLSSRLAAQCRGIRAPHLDCCPAEARGQGDKGLQLLQHSRRDHGRVDCRWCQLPLQNSCKLSPWRAGATIAGTSLSSVAAHACMPPVLLASVVEQQDTAGAQEHPLLQMFGPCCSAEHRASTSFKLSVRHSSVQRRECIMYASNWSLQTWTAASVFRHELAVGAHAATLQPWQAPAIA